MKTLAWTLLGLAGYLMLQLHKLASGCAAIARHAAFRLVDLVVDLARIGAYVALALLAWYLIDPATASARLSALPTLRLWL